jgi:NitT/TauT family transport system substrate-binding protein
MKISLGIRAAKIRAMSLMIAWNCSKRRWSGPGNGLTVFTACLLALIAGSTPLPAQQAADAPLKKISLLLDWYPQAEQGGYYYAVVNGLYKKAGLDVDIIPISPNVVGGAQLMTGRVQFSLTTSADVLTARSRGLPLVAVMAAMQHDPKGVIVHAESPIHSFADLDGHALAVAPGSAWFRYIVQKYHLSHIQENRLTLNNAYFLHDPNYSQECYVTAEPYFIEKSGQKVRTLLVKDTGFDNYRVVATSDSFLANNKDVVKAFVAATIAGWQGYFKDPTATDAEIKKRNPEMTQGQMDYTFKVLVDDHFIDGDASHGETIGQINMTRVKDQYQILRSLNVLPDDFDYTKAFDTEYCAPETAPHP